MTRAFSYIFLKNLQNECLILCNKKLDARGALDQILYR